jgi:hypothetical protein
MVICTCSDLSGIVSARGWYELSTLRKLFGCLGSASGRLLAYIEVQPSSSSSPLSFSLSFQFVGVREQFGDRVCTLCEPVPSANVSRLVVRVVADLIEGRRRLNNSRWKLFEKDAVEESGGDYSGQLVYSRTFQPRSWVHMLPSMLSPEDPALSVRKPLYEVDIVRNFFVAVAPVIAVGSLIDGTQSSAKIGWVQRNICLILQYLPSPMASGPLPRVGPSKDPSGRQRLYPSIALALYTFLVSAFVPPLETDSQKTRGSTRRPHL